MLASCVRVTCSPFAARGLFSDSTAYSCTICGEDLTSKASAARIKHVRACEGGKCEKASGLKVAAKPRKRPAKDTPLPRTDASAAPTASTQGVCNLCGHTNRAADVQCGIVAGSELPTGSASLSFAIGEIDTALRSLRDRWAIPCMFTL